MSEVLEIAVREEKVLRMNGQDYTLTFPLPIVVELEQKLGRSMKNAADWFRIQTKEVQAVLEAALTRHHPEDAARLAEEISNGLDPEQIDHVLDALCTAACPRAMARLTADMEKARERIKQGLAPVPNVPGVAAS